MWMNQDKFLNRVTVELNNILHEPGGAFAHTLKGVLFGAVVGGASISFAAGSFFLPLLPLAGPVGLAVGLVVGAVVGGMFGAGVGAVAEAGKSRRRSKVRAAQPLADDLLKRREVKEALCAALRPLPKNEPQAIARAVTKTLLPLVRKGKLGGKPDPLLFALVCASIYRTRIKSFCK